MNILFVDPSMRSTGVYAIINGKVESYTLTTSCEHIEALGEIAAHFYKKAQEFDVLVIEDYAFSRASQSVSKNAEVGGIIRSAFSALKKPVIEIPISTWKKITGVRLKKTTASEKRFYIDTVSALADRNFDSTDACDAWMMYFSCRWLVIENNPQTEAQVELKRKLQQLGLAFIKYL